MRDILISETGAVADGVTLNTRAIQRAIDLCHENGGGRVVVSGGRYRTGTVVLKSNVNLHIAADGVLLGSPHCEDYPEREDVRHVESSLLPRWRNACMIYAEEGENISLTGNGTIDCSGDQFVRRIENCPRSWRYTRIDAPTPPRVVFFAGCRNVTIRDVTMTHQPAGWSYWITDCDYVTVDGLRIIADVDFPNNDGIHINCSRNVTVSNCSITTGDDCIVVRANSVALRENKVCERVTVTNCNLTSYSGGIRIGWINDGMVRNCTFSNIVMTDTSVGISILLPHVNPDGKGTAPSDIGRESTCIENLSFCNIIMDKTASCPIQIDLADQTTTRCTAIRNLYFSGIHACGPELPYIKGRPDVPVQNISFCDCTFTQTDGSEFDNLQYHGYCRHYDGEFYPMYLKHAENITFSNTRLDIRR